VLGGVVMFTAAALYFLVLIRTAFSPSTEPGSIDFPAHEVLHEERRVGLLHNFRPWLVLMAIALLLAYLPAFRDVFSFTGAKAPPYSPENPIPLELYEPPEN